ncbi:MAG: phage tail sheath subtilisin-like domain-containing protein [Isosphaeraceae bacterium]
MPTTYSVPGIYVEDVPPLSRPIAGVSTSTAGFIGIAEDLMEFDQMPVNPRGRRFRPGAGKVTSDGKGSLSLSQDAWAAWVKGGKEKKPDANYELSLDGRTYVAQVTSGDTSAKVELVSPPQSDYTKPIAFQLRQIFKKKAKLTAANVANGKTTITLDTPPSWLGDPDFDVANYELTINGQAYPVETSTPPGTLTVGGALSPGEIALELARKETQRGYCCCKSGEITFAPRTWPEWADEHCYVTLRNAPEVRAWIQSRPTDGKLGLKSPPDRLNQISSSDDLELVDAYYRQAPDKTPVQVTSWEQFRNHFGDFSESNLNLALAVYSFFNNGGTRCYVVRIKDARDLEVDLEPCLKVLDAIDEISIVAAPLGSSYEGQLQFVHEALVTHCTTMRNRIAVLDCERSDTTESFDSARPPTSPEGYGALYFPWLKVANPLSLTTGEPTVSIPPSGAIAGIYARVDAQRGVHKAPANEAVHGVLELEYAVSKNEQGELNDLGVNCIRNLYGATVVWGARTLAAKPGGEAEWKYVNVRRFMNFLRASLEENLQWVVFEPNDPGLWQRITRTVSDFLTTQWRAGALFGQTPKQAFFVRCDASTNPPELRDLGQVVTEVGVAVVKPAEFVIIRIQQQSGG